MHHSAALVVELNLSHGQPIEPEEQCRVLPRPVVLPCTVVLDRLKLRRLNQAPDLTFVTMN
jgi:hypothetical protein